jgi:hypothetical protein
MLPSEPDPNFADVAPPELKSAAAGLAEGGLLELPAGIATAQAPSTTGAAPLLPPPPGPELEAEPISASIAESPSDLPREPEAAPVDASTAAQPASAVDTVPIVVPSSRPHSDARELERAAADARASRGTLWAWTAAFVALVAIGFLADRARNTSKAPKLEAIGASSPSPPTASTPVGPAAPLPTASSTQPVPTALPALPNEEPRSARKAAVRAEEAGFQIYDRVLDESVAVAPDQALLLVQTALENAGASLTIDGRLVGPLPAKAALSEGMHELAISRGDSVSYRFLAPRRGATWVLREP